MSDLSDPLPDPNELLDEALAEPDKHYLIPYRQTIHELRARNFSYRQIAEWLNQRGLNVDHNAIYREHTKHMTYEEERLQDTHDDRLEQEEEN